MPFLYKKGGRLPGQKSSTVAEAVSAARTSFPNSGQPGDAMMPFTQAPGEGVPSIPEPPNPYAPGGSRHVPWMDGPDSRADIGIGRANFPSWSPEVSQGFEPSNPYSWTGIPGGGSVVPPGTEDFLTSTDWTSGITPPSAQTFPSASSYIPDPEFGAVNQYSPAPVNSPFVGAGDPLLADTTTQYDFMAGMNPATGAMAPGSAGAAWTPTGYDVMAGMDPATGPMGYGANPDPYGPLGDRYVPWQSGSPNEQTDVGMGIFPENDDFRGPPDPGGVRRIYEDSEDATRADMGPLANNLERTSVDYDVAREYDKTSKEINQRLADQRIAEHEARFGAMKAEEAERQEKYLEDLAKIQKKQRMFMVLGALSGDPNIARMAGMIAQQDMAVLNKKYEWASGDRTAQMQQALMYNSNGEYDPPESRQELYSALSTMGANSTEMDWFDTQFFGSDVQGQNWYNPQTKDYQWTDSGQSPGAGYLEIGDYKVQSDADSGTGTKGAQRDEIAAIRSEVSRIEAAYGEDSAQAVKAREYLDLTEKLYGAVEDITKKDPWMSTTLIKAQMDLILDNHKSIANGSIDWESVSEEIGEDVANAEDFTKWFKGYVKSINNPVDPELLGIPQGGENTFTSEADVKAAIKSGKLKKGDSFTLNGEEYEVTEE